jgi:hypothetical protein
VIAACLGWGCAHRKYHTYQYDTLGVFPTRGL